VDFPPTSMPYYTSVFHAGTSFVFNNDVIIVIVGTAGSQTFYNYGATPIIGSIPDPTAGSSSATPPDYVDGLNPDEVGKYTLNPANHAGRDHQGHRNEK
jgi:hypothetical protein